MTEISIVTPLYNKEKYIKETIDSVIAQKFEDWEMLIIDNGSTDSSLEIAKKFQDPRIHILSCLKRGPGAARNHGIKKASGRWIQFLDADDILLPEHLNKQLAISKNHPQADIIVSCWQVFLDSDPDNRILHKPNGFGESVECLLNSSIAYTAWAPHAAIIKSSMFSDDYLWPEELDRFLAEDTAFWFRLVNKCKVVYNSSADALYRAEVHGSRTNFDPEKWFQGIHEAIKYNLKYLKQISKSVNSEQCESLVRLYTGLYIHACSRKSIVIQEKALKEANFWLKYYFQSTYRFKLSMFVRRLIGVQLSSRLIGR